ncbi:LPS biosynthesis protein [Natronorubrum tibetense GA33]|uniref:LPS biosynthesis protein n=2 Tax=Natronorubrum tibetense TaxID=63128 RepID=L9VKL6_9EURY|nr:LPS biosynthesis protein [Natronorubrum tibetense GA33]
MGHDVTVLTSDNGDRKLPRGEHRDGYRVIRHRQMIEPVGNSITPGIVQTLRKEVPKHDIVHLHSHLYFMSNVAAAIARFSDTPVVMTNHGVWSDTAPRWLLNAFNPTVGRFTWGTADRVFCYTETDRDRLRNWNVNTEVRIIPNGIDTDRFAPDPEIDRKKQILFVARLKYNKGAQFLLEAFSTLADEFSDYSIKIVGDGPMREKLPSIAAELGVRDCVSFTGELPNHELPRHYNESELFVLPSLNEGLPRTVLEAMACETPVITSDLEQLGPVVEGAGYTVPTESTEALAERLDDLLGSEERREGFGKTGRKKVIESYSWDDTVRETTEEYYSVIQ